MFFQSYDDKCTATFFSVHSVVRPIATDVWRGWSVGLSVCDVTDMYPAKTAGPIEMPFGMWGGVAQVTMY